MSLDVAIIGGGPSGSTCGSLIKRYSPSTSVAIFEREVFPRDHIGESLLPSISSILDEMGCWDAIEAAGFPIKLGATYRWGKQPELWDFDFVPRDHFKEQPRPAKFEGQRRHTAFQVDRSLYDKILLDHAASLGCKVRQGTKVAQVNCSGNRVESITTESGEKIAARHYVDASGNSGILRRAMGVDCEIPPSLKNIAIYDYWQNAEWAVEIGVGGTRIQIRSLGYGWIWFIPIGPTRTSIGLVVPVDYFKHCGKKPEQLYAEALAEEPMVAQLIKHAQSENRLTATRDWSFIANRHAGENWLLVGESAGFADPILSAGVSMAHTGGKEAAFTILELDRGEEDALWLLDQYERRQKQRISTHIRFGDYWYTANEQLKDLKQFTSQLASDIGLELNPESAWDWIARGGFINEDCYLGSGGFTLSSIRDSGGFLADLNAPSPLETTNVLSLSLDGAREDSFAVHHLGRVSRAPCLIRGERFLPLSEEVNLLIRLLGEHRELRQVVRALNDIIRRTPPDPEAARIAANAGSTLEAMIHDGWIAATHDPGLPLSRIARSPSGFHLNTDQLP